MGGKRRNIFVLLFVLGLVIVSAVIVVQKPVQKGLDLQGGIELTLQGRPTPQVSPPTINIFNQDPECDLDYCANTARAMKIEVALKNNFGFGGTNGTLVFRRA